ncbi:hypothetical protein BCR36DRAFT_438862 [Piromyces finnis]|uniref:Aspartic peptidase DDI1-type domain-containing protein n=1 Tax=Piromyces finnis TaxID=1754191 RepID=A0A1Y1VNN1_9FUNG|nr:hypothetical protein BCR36DRAFT_438862 [Piromyces finnis]|eukprot:ORX60742.1 hypothetical protein BCR36DRAFT_438862 [Piromyces finnis]
MNNDTNINNNESNESNKIDNNINNSTNSTETLKQLDPSFINQPTIDKAKRNNKKEREKEIIELAKEIELPSQKEKNVSNEKGTKRLVISADQEKYNITKDIGEKFANITIGQLLEISPKLKTELSKALKFTKIIEDESTILSTIRKDKVVKSKCKIEGIETTVYLDSCSSINMITRRFLLENNISLKPVSKIRETLYQAYSNTTIESHLYEIEITIGNITSKEIFRLIEKEDIFQVLIGVETLANMKLIMDFSDHTLYQKTDDIHKIGSFESINEMNQTNLIEEFDEEINQYALIYYLTSVMLTQKE